MDINHLTAVEAALLLGWKAVHEVDATIPEPLAHVDNILYPHYTFYVSILVEKDESEFRLAAVYEVEDKEYPRYLSDPDTFWAGRQPDYYYAF